MKRRDLCQWIAVAMPASGWAASVPEQALSLYGLTLKGARADAFVSAALAAGARPLPPAPGMPPTFDVRAVGVPALERLTLVTHEDQVAMVRFVVKGYGADNQALRGLLVGKYGIPMTVSPRPLPFGAFGARAAPHGGFQWRFADDMVLVYEHPRIGEVSLSYIDGSRVDPRDLGRKPGETRRIDDSVRDRF